MKNFVTSYLTIFFTLFLVTSSIAQESADSIVHLIEDEKKFILSNSTLTVEVSKKTCNLSSILFQNIEILDKNKTDEGGYWSLPGTKMKFGSKLTYEIVQNDGNRVSVGCTFLYDGKQDSAPVDTEFQYSLGKKDTAIYIAGNWKHRAEYPNFSIPVGRFTFKLNDDYFDWMTIDSARNLKMITSKDWNNGTELNLKEVRRMNSGIKKGKVEHKYDYSAILSETPTYGWASTSKNIGAWLINPSYEYMSGGPTKLELTAHRDAKFNFKSKVVPTILNIWKGPHYGSSYLQIKKGQYWEKTMGPFLLYLNQEENHEKLWKKAILKAKIEKDKWPYNWVKISDYPKATDRATVSGKLIINSQKAKKVKVGLVAPEKIAEDGTVVNWELNGENYQYWTNLDENGYFRIENVRKGNYVLHAIAENILGQFKLENVNVSSAKLDVGDLIWEQQKRGDLLWEIGIPNRSSSEFFKGNEAYQWGLYYAYTKFFPNDIQFEIGKSDIAKDWYLMQVPHATEKFPNQFGKETIWKIKFKSPRKFEGKGYLTISFAGAEKTTLSVNLNGKEIGKISDLKDTQINRRNANRSIEQIRIIPFDANLLNENSNSIELIIPKGNITAGVQYDYLKLEVE